MSARKPLTPNYHWQQFDEQSVLAKSLADRIELEIEHAISARGRAIIAFSGGSTPKPLFRELATRNIDWPRVIVTLVDERWVPIGHQLSNADLLLQNLLNELPSHPKFVPLFTICASAMNAEQSLIPVMTDYCHQTNSTHGAPAALDVVILGMGNDGHTASFFPDAENIAQLVDINCRSQLLSCTSPSAQVDRVTWSLPFLLNTGLLALHITGASKKAVFEQALQDDNALQLPIRATIFQDRTELQVYYAD